MAAPFAADGESNGGQKLPAAAPALGSPSREAMKRTYALCKASEMAMRPGYGADGCCLSAFLTVRGPSREASWAANGALSAWLAVASGGDRGAKWYT